MNCTASTSYIASWDFMFPLTFMQCYKTSQSFPKYYDLSQMHAYNPAKKMEHSARICCVEAIAEANSGKK